MTQFKSGIAAAMLITSLSLGACATTPDPAKVCTAEWIKPRAAKAVKELRKETGRTLKSLKRSAAKLDNGGSLSAYQAMRMMSSMQTLVKRLQNGRGVKDLRTLSATCDDPAIVRDGVVGYMEDAGAPQSLLKLLRDVDFSKAPEPSDLDS